jgi:hypothetical protein
MSRGLRGGKNIMNTLNTATGVVRPRRNFRFEQRPKKRAAIVHWRLPLAAGPRFARALRTLLAGWGFIPTATVNAMTRPRSCRGGVALYATLLALMLRAPTCLFASSAVSESSIDSGGLRTSSANYTMDNSIGGIDGISGASADTAKNGYIGQLTEVVSVTVTSTPDSVGSGSTSQLSATATLDDSTVSSLSGSDVAWSSPNEPYPVASISGSGVLTPADVYYVQPAAVDAVVDGYYLGASNATMVALYAPDSIGDGIPDWWRNLYFGAATPTNSEDCATCDADGTGQNNYFKFVAGLNPTNPASVFVLKVAPVAGQPTQKALTYNPIVVGFGQTYTVQYRTNLTGGATFATLTTTSALSTNGGTVSLNDTQATQTQKFYRVNISLP